MTEAVHQTVVGEVRIVALSRISPGPEFNPRTGRDPERFAQLVASVKADGVLQPLLVTPEPEGDGLRLVAGEGRWLAAGEAGQLEVPVHIVDVDARTGGLELAMAENLARQDLDPVQEANGYERLRQAGLTKKGISERLGVAPRRVTERLELLKLPEELHPQIASGQVPPAAVKPLVALERIQPGLAACAVARINATPPNAWSAPLTWADLVSDPIGVLVSDANGPGTELPGGVFDLADNVPVDRFSLSDQARGQLDELCGLIGMDPAQFEVRFGREAHERASALKAAHATKDGWHHLLVGQDLADELAADYIAACLTNQRDMAERLAAQEAGSGDDVGAGDQAAAPSQEQVKEQRRAERAEQDRARAEAVAHNAALGAAVLKHLARLKVDTDVLKVLTAIDVAGDLEGVAGRGARYVFPGWPVETAQKNGRVKVEYLDKPQAGAKAREFLAGAATMAEIAGRLFCLIAAARYADEQAVARSNRSFSSLRVRDGLPYSPQVLDLVDELCAQRLPDHLTAAVRDERARQREAIAEHERETRAARDRLTRALERAGELTDDEREQALADIDVVHGRYSVDGHKLRRQLQTPAPARADSVGVPDEPAAQAA